MDASRAFSVRRANLGDAEVVFGLLAQLGEQYAPRRESFDAAFVDIVDQDDHLLFVAESDESVVGYALATIARLFYSNGDAAQIQEIVVDETVRGSGVGSQLVAAVEAECQSRGVHQLTVATLRNASFYERLDYRSTADFLKKRFVEE